MSLRARLWGQFLLLGVVPVLVLFGAAWVFVVPALVDQAEARNRELALAVRDQVNLQLDQRLRAAAMLGDGLRDDPPSPAALHRSLQAMLLRDTFLQAAYVADGRSLVIDAALAAQGGRFTEDAIGLDLSRQRYVSQARASKLPIWSDTFLSTLTGQVTAALALPAGERIVVLELSLAALSKSVIELAQSGSIQVVIVDRVGHVIAHPDTRLALQQTSLSDLPLVQSALGGAALSRRSVRNGVEELGHAMPVESVGWAVLVSQPLSAVMSPLLRLGGAMLGVLATTVLLAMLVGWRLARRTGVEVAQLADGAQHALSGDGMPPALSFSTAEFNAVWTRLRDLFQQLHQRDQQTRSARQDLQAVLDAATQVAVVATDRTGCVTVFNIGAQRMLGYLAAEVVGKQTFGAWHDKTELASRSESLSRKHGQVIEGVEALLVEPRHSGYEVRDWSWVRRDGSRLEVSLAVTAMRTPEGELKGFLGVAVDITERRRAAALELARKSAELANQAKSDFLSKMSHELRTPLNAILGFAQLIDGDRTQPPTPRQRDGVQHILRAGWHLVRLIDDVLDLARIESGRLGVTIVAVDLGPVLGHVKEMVASQMHKHGVTLTVAVTAAPDGVARRVAADETRLVQVLVNLLSNAAKYNRPQGEVRLQCRFDASSVRLEVADTGRGMTAEQLGHLYEPFNRLGREGGAVEGTGIGLVITRNLVEMMHGRIEVQSEPGVGTTVVVTLPVAPADPAGTPAGPDLRPGGAGTPSTMPGRVVYIEDNAVNAQLMRAILRQRPHIDLQTHALAGSGLDAIRAEPPDLLMLDMHLPDASGEQVLAALQADPRLCRIPVLVVSADATHARVEALLQLGAKAYLTKPLEVAEVLRHVDRLLGSSATEVLAPAAD